MSWIDLATPEKVLEPAELDKGKTWAAYQTTMAAMFKTNPPRWLGETSSAACGGEPGVSNTFASTFFWLDQLGYMATYNQQIVARQTLAGGTYALLPGPGANVAPSPDYYASVLWKRLMGTTVLDVSVPSASPKLRAYAHCAPASSSLSGGITLLLINLDKAVVSVSLPPSLSGLLRTEFQLTSPSGGLTSTTIALNGVTLTLASNGSLPLLNGVSVAPSRAVKLAATSSAFISFQAPFQLCKSSSIWRR